MLTSNCTITESYPRSENFQKYLEQGEKQRIIILNIKCFEANFVLKFYMIVVLCCISYIFPTKLKGEKSNICLFIKSDLVVKTPCLLWKNEEKKGDELFILIANKCVKEGWSAYDSHYVIDKNMKKNAEVSVYCNAYIYTGCSADRAVWVQTTRSSYLAIKCDLIW